MKYEVVFCIVNNGFSEAVMDAAKMYGARGGTILRARGTASKEAEKIFSAFDKVPEALWEEEHEKYRDVLDVYKNIKVYRWAAN